MPALLPEMGDQPLSETEVADEIDRYHRGEPLLPEQTVPWSVGDERAAEWALRKLARLRAEMQEAEDQADEYRSQVDAWLADRTHGARRSAAYFENVLRNWAIGNRTEECKSFKLPSGTVKTRAGSLTVEIDDEEKFCTWALEHGRHDLLNVKPARAAIRHQLAPAEGAEPILVDPQTGEIIPGVVLVRGDVSATVETSR
jgi:hypothetical protein